MKKTKTGYSTDAEVLEQLAPLHGIVQKLLEYRQLVKLKSTYAEGLANLVNPATGRIHSSFNQTVTATGRISSTEPNLQNIPVKLEMGREIRKVFVPESDEYLLSDADYSQIELRVLAHITGDENLVNAFKNNEDIHTATAMGIFRVNADEVTPLMRSRAKTINFSIVYGIGDFSLSKDLGITRKEAKKYIEEYFGRYPGVSQYMHDIVQKGREDGYVATMFNRKRSLPELSASNHNVRAFGERVAMNTPIQGTAADILKLALGRLVERLPDHPWLKPLLQIHDELVFELPADRLHDAVAFIRECMDAQPFPEMDVPIVAEAAYGTNFGHMEEIEP
jgi:DNA polymerase-1